MSRFGVIYKATNMINNMAYIGQTIQPITARLYQHNHSSHCSVFSQALRKYGSKNFTIEILNTSFSLNKLNEFEEKIIKEHNTQVPFGYNLLAGGNNKRHSEQTKQKMSTTKTGFKIPSLSVSRGPYPKERCLNISKGKKGNNGLIGTRRYGMKQPKLRKAIIGTSLVDNSKIEFESISSAGKWLGVYSSNIVACLKGRKTSIAGHVWEYK